MPTIESMLAQGAPPAIAVLRGLTPGEALSIGRALIDGGVRMLEVPLNSPDPFASIEALQRAYGGDALIGAGTVLDESSAGRLAQTGARLMVTPDVDAAVIERGIAEGLEVMPGFLTPSEALRATRAGARRLKLFPISSVQRSHIKAVRDVLPADAHVWAVGGVDSDNARDYLDAGAEGVAAGGWLYRPGDEAEAVRRKAEALVAALG